MSPTRLVAFLSAAVASFAFTGCTIPNPAYRQVDKTSPQFKAAVAVETERLIAATDRSAASAARKATENVTRQFIEDEKTRRTQKVAPLTEVMAKFEQPRGCWAYTITTTKHEKGVTTVTVENFDAFQPEERLWTLVSRDGQAPDEKAQAEYRAKRLKAWKKAQAREPKHTQREAINARSLFEDLEVVTTDNEPRATYTFRRESARIPLVGKGGAFRETYVTDRMTTTLTQRISTLLEPLSIFAGTANIQEFQSTTDYATVAPDVPPFPVTVAIRFRGSVFGKEMDLRQEAIYSNYRRVKCYDDRFEVKIGTTDVMDFLPERN